MNVQSKMQQQNPYPLSTVATRPAICSAARFMLIAATLMRNRWLESQG